MQQPSSDDGNQPTHFFACSPYRYQRGRTREAAIENLRMATPLNELRAAILYQQGLHIRTWHVLADMITAYPISTDFVPQGVTLADPLEYRMISTAGRLVPIVPDPDEPEAA